MSRLMIRRRSAPVVAGGFSPLDIGWDTLFWADDITGLADGAPVETWTDSSGNGHDATQSTSATKRPVFRAAHAGLNGHAAVEFDGVDDFMSTAAFPAVANGEIAVVAHRRPGSGTAQGSYFDGITTSNRWRACSRQGGTAAYGIGQGATFITGGTEDYAKHYIRGDYGITDALFVDGTQVASGNAGAETLTGLRLGSNANGSGSFFPGHIALLGFKASPLTPTEQSDMLAWSRSYYETP